IVFAPLAGTDPLQDRNRSHSPQGIFTQTSTPSTRRLMFVPLRPQLEQEKRPSRRSAHWSQKGQRTSTESHFRYWISWSASRKRSSGPPMALLLRSVRTTVLGNQSVAKASRRIQSRCARSFPIAGEGRSPRQAC